MSIQFISGNKILGFQVRILGGGKGQTKLFSIKKYGMIEAEKLAREYEKKALQQLPPPHRRVHCNNSSGVRGFRIEWREYRIKGSFYPNIICSTI